VALRYFGVTVFRAGPFAVRDSGEIKFWVGSATPEYLDTKNACYCWSKISNCRFPESSPPAPCTDRYASLIALRRDWKACPEKRARGRSVEFLRANSFYFPALVVLGDFVSLVVQGLSFAEADVDFYPAVLEVERQGNQGESLFHCLSV